LPEEESGGPERCEPGAAGMVVRSSSAHVFVADLASPALCADDAHHLLRVLRLRPGEIVGASDGRGGWRACRLVGSGELESEGDPVAEDRSWPTVTVGLAVPKGDRADWAVQKLTEVGVDRIVPLRSELGVVRWEDDRAGRRVARWRAIARSAAMQSRRLWLPEVTDPATVGEILGRCSGESARLAAGPTGSDADDGRFGPADWYGPAALAEPGGRAPTLDRPTVLVGPEGGWAAAEREVAPATVGLGTTVLRTETAAVVAGGILVALRSGLVAPAGRRRAPVT